MDRLSKWATTGSLAWLLMAVGLILGKHGGSLWSAQADVSPDAPAIEACPEATPVAAAITPNAWEGDVSALEVPRDFRDTTLE